MKSHLRQVIALVSLAVGLRVIHRHAPQLRKRFAVGCEKMLEQMPEDFPPNRMLHGIEDLRADTARIVELLEGRQAGERPEDV